MIQLFATHKYKTKLGDISSEKVEKIFGKNDCLFGSVFTKTPCEDGYELNGELSFQGYSGAKVFHAKCNDNDKFVAKLINFENTVMSSFFKEIFNQIKISNIPNIAPTIHQILLCKDNSNTVLKKGIFIMDLLDGQNLESYMREKIRSCDISYDEKNEKNQKDVLDIFDLINLIKEKIETLHSNGWIHGDCILHNMIFLNDKKDIQFIDFSESYQPLIKIQELNNSDYEQVYISLMDVSGIEHHPGSSVLPYNIQNKKFKKRLSDKIKRTFMI